MPPRKVTGSERSEGEALRRDLQSSPVVINHPETKAVLHRVRSLAGHHSIKQEK